MFLKYQRHYFGLLLAAMMSLGWSSLSLAQDTDVAEESATVSADKKDLPTGKAVFAEHVEAIGGKDKIKAIKSTVAEAEMQFQQLGVTGKMKATQVAPSRFIVTVDIPQIGQVMKCADGDFAWEVHPITGARILEGEERDAFLREADMQAQLHPEKYFKSIECVDCVDIEGNPAYKLEFTTHADNVETNYYDKDSKMLVRSERETPTAMGDIKLSIDFDDFQQAGGMKVPFKTTVTAMGQVVMVTKVTSLKNDVQIDESVFETPEEIKELMEIKTEATTE